MVEISAKKILLIQEIFRRYDSNVNVWAPVYAEADQVDRLEMTKYYIV